jgi:hypothetical protein
MFLLSLNTVSSLSSRSLVVIRNKVSRLVLFYIKPNLWQD